MLLACNNKSIHKNALTSYDLSKPEKFSMPESLLEISGIAFNKGNPDTVYAIQDEEGRLFKLAWNNKKQVNAKFGKAGDYEDVAILKDKVIVLKSNGTLYSFNLADAIYPRFCSWIFSVKKAELSVCL